jgi:putative ABC transport system permease protein
MIRHLLQLVWNRKGKNALIILEIFFSFLVVFGVSSVGLHLWANWRSPLGFDPRDVWIATLDPGAGGERVDREQWATFERLLQETRSLPAVVAVAGAMTSPYGREMWTSSWQDGNGNIGTELGLVTLGYEKTLGLELVEGRFFAEGDAALNYRPVVINAGLARRVFGDESPLGRQLGTVPPGGGTPERRVIGVMGEFRREGELAAPGHFTFALLDEKDRTPRKLTIKTRPGTSAEFEEQLVKRLQAVAPGWTFEADSLARMRTASFRERLTPLAAAAIVALFLLLMVGLGLIGVLWQNLLRRRREIGLRRALGAARGEIHLQFLAEQLILASFGLLLGLVVLMQLPLLELAGWLSPAEFTGGILLAMASMYLLAGFCALYPSVMVSRVLPAEALRYE